MIQTLMTVLAIAALAGLRRADPVPQTGASGAVELPAPTGPYPVATTTWRLTDPARKETFSSAGGSSARSRSSPGIRRPRAA